MLEGFYETLVTTLPVGRGFSTLSIQNKVQEVFWISNRKWFNRAAVKIPVMTALRNEEKAS
jgi:hypothetical protein